MSTAAEIRVQIRDLVRKFLFATPAGESNDIRNTNFFKILAANPSLSRIWRQSLQRCSANPSAIKDLEIRSGNFFDPDQSSQSETRASSKGSASMAIQQNIPACSHVKVNGVRCGSPALHGEVFCYFHQRMIRGVRTPPSSRLHPIALLEDEESIQAALMEIVNALVRNQIDIKRAQLVLRALHIAVKNARRVHFDLSEHDMICDVPKYPAPPETPKPPEAALQQAAALAKWKRPKTSDWELIPD
jgi:hypothetical protein